MMLVTMLGAFVAMILAGIAAATFLVGLLVRATNQVIPVKHRQRTETDNDATQRGAQSPKNVCQPPAPPRDNRSRR